MQKQACEIRNATRIDALTMNKNFVRKPPNKLLSTKLPVCGAVEIYGLQNQGISKYLCFHSKLE